MSLQISPAFFIFFPKFQRTIVFLFLYGFKIFYHVVTKKEPYDETKVVRQPLSKERIIKRLQKKAAQQGYKLVLAKAS